ncbi:hypothetical protein V3C99_018023 [Haemonchus contortus]|uniref:Integrase n=1 Tax=Haemonchus contortus TaxID=6289 RepID=A0A7I4Z2Z5_HAECO
MLYYFEKAWKMEEPSRHLNELSGDKTIETLMNHQDNLLSKNCLAIKTYWEMDDLMAYLEPWIAFKNRNARASGIGLSSK